MGWTYTYKPQGTKVRPFLRERFSQPFIAGEKDGFRILHDTATLRAYFAIVERSPQDGRTPVLFCLVCLTDHVRNPYNFGYKDMTEACGPNIIPPKSFFDVLERMIPQPDGAYGAARPMRVAALSSLSAPARSSSFRTSGTGCWRSCRGAGFVSRTCTPADGISCRAPSSSPPVW